MLQDSTRDWNVEQDLRPNYYLAPYDYILYIQTDIGTFSV